MTATDTKIRLRVAVIVLRDDHILLVRDPVYRGGCWTPPGGRVEFDESIVQAAAREVFEETGTTVRCHGLWRLREIWEPDPDADRVAGSTMRKSLELMLIGNYVSGEIDIESDPSRVCHREARVADARWIPLASLFQGIDGVRVLPEELAVVRSTTDFQAIPLAQVLSQARLT